MPIRWDYQSKTRWIDRLTARIMKASERFAALRDRRTGVRAQFRRDSLSEWIVEFREAKICMKVAIIGGGLAGLTAAAYLSEQPGFEGVLFERSPQLGGRAFTYEKAGFTLNYGAHAIYGLDRHTLSVMERELHLQFRQQAGRQTQGDVRER